MNENLEGKFEVRGAKCEVDFFDFRKRTLAGEHDDGAAQFTRKLHAGGAGDSHLRGGMNRKIRRELADEPADANVLGEGRVHSRRDDSAQFAFGPGHFVLEHERVETDVAARTAPVQELHQSRQIGFGEIARALPGAEFFQAEVNRVRAVLHRRFRAVPIAGRGKQFRQGRRAEGGGRTCSRVRS